MHSLVSRSMAALGALLLLVAALQPWMEVPSGISTQPGGKVICTTTQPRSALAFRAGCLAIAIVFGSGHAWHRRTSDRKAMLASASLAALLFFPSIVMSREPSISARATWLQIQHENLTQPLGDLWTNLEYSRKSWKDRIYLVDTPPQINVVHISSSGLKLFQFGGLFSWFELFGYSNRYCQFVRRGWIAGLLGMSMLIAGECLPGGRPSRRRACRATMVWMATALAGMLAVSIPVMTAARALERARRATALGLYDDAESHLRASLEALPALGEDTFYVAQMGLLDFRRGRDSTPEGRLFRANLMVRQGRYAQSMQTYTALVAEAPKGSAIHREANRAILREATQVLNGGRYDEAIRWLEAVLREEPCNLGANYALQLAYLRTDRRVELERLVRRIEATYGHFQAITKDIVLASCHENEMFAALKQGDMDATFLHALRTKSP